MCPNNQAKKRFGQNFLADKDIIDQIIGIIAPKYLDNLVEIGPGKGALTDKILSFKPKSLILIEKDDVLAKELKIKYNDV